MRAFLQHFTVDRDNLARQAREIMRSFETNNAPVGADGQVRRVCGRFALVAAAGELGVSFGVLPWPTGEASRAAATCFKAWVDQRGGIGTTEMKRLDLYKRGCFGLESKQGQEVRTKTPLSLPMPGLTQSTAVDALPLYR
ncbi:MAG: hypothetical protein Q8S17_01970 [Humidesulfovibrio sp.]|nr:hypothetical protein [Humidesulfovibrio sp.]